MIRKQIQQIIGIVALLGFFLIGCQPILIEPSPSHFTSPLDQPDLTVADAAAIYAAVIRELTDDLTTHSVYYVVRHTNEQRYPRAAISPDLEAAITKAVGYQASRMAWVERYEDVEWVDGIVVKNGGAILSFGAITPLDPATVEVHAESVYGNLGAQGGTFVIERQHEQWQVTTVKNMWVS